MSKRYTYTAEIVCAWCKKAATVKRNGKRIPRFCDRSCSAKWRMRQPEVVAAVHNPAVRKKRTAALRKALCGKPRPDAARRMRADNPMWMKGVKTKAIETKKKNGTFNVWLGTRGGNGTHTPQQLKIWKALGGDWQLELPIATKLSPPFPTAYKVDVGHRKEMVAVEIDGKGHRTEAGRLKDEKKDRALRGLGWTVLRFTNEQVDKTPRKVIRTILSSCTA